MWVLLVGLHENKIKNFKIFKNTRLRTFVLNILKSLIFFYSPFMVDGMMPWLLARCMRPSRKLGSVERVGFTKKVVRVWSAGSTSPWTCSLVAYARFRPERCLRMDRLEVR